MGGSGAAPWSSEAAASPAQGCGLLELHKDTLRIPPQSVCKSKPSGQYSDGILGACLFLALLIKMEGKKEILQQQLRREQFSASAYEYAGCRRASGRQRSLYLHLPIFLRQLGDVAVAYSFISSKKL